MASQNDQVPMQEAAGPHFQIGLRNNLKADNVHAYVYGNNSERGGSLFVLRADGKTPYYPPSPSQPGTPLDKDCAIKLGKHGSTTQVTVPHLDSARIYFAVGKLAFRLDPGPAIVQPSESNTSDPNYDTRFAFAEFTWNTAELFANISFVDFVGLPVGLTLQTKSGKKQHVTGIPADGLATICQRLSNVEADQDWAKLAIKTKSDDWLRALSPYQGMKLHPGLFRGYDDKYVDKMWAKYVDQPLLVNTQAEFGTLKGHVRDGVLHVGKEAFKKPSTADIFSCNSGPFKNPDEDNKDRIAIVPRLCAGFNRTTLLDDNKTPDPDGRKDYYRHPVTNHYARIVHEVTADGRGYAFAYDDVQPDGGKDQSGKVSASDPESLVVTVGGGGDGQD